MARKLDNRNLRDSRLTVIGEGYTEQYYFKHLKDLKNYHFRIKPNFFGVTSIDEFERKIRKVLSEYEIAICVFDTDIASRDEVEKKKLNSLIKKYAKSKDVIFCDSLPSIEYWFLLHYINTNRYYSDSKSIIAELNKSGRLESFEKKQNYLQKPDWVLKLLEDNKLNDARERAKSFGTVGESYSNIYKAFEELEKTKK